MEVREAFSTEEENPSLSRTRWFSREHLLRDRHGRQRTPGRIHDVPRPLKSDNLCGDGHGRREDGHTDKSGTREEAGGGDGATRAPGRGGKRTAGGEKKGKRRTANQREGHLGNGATHAPVGDNWGARRTGRNDPQRTRTRHVANPAEGDRVHPHGELRGPHGDEPGQLPPTWEERTHTQSIDHGKLQRQRSGDGLKPGSENEPSDRRRQGVVDGSIIRKLSAQLAQ